MLVVFLEKQVARSLYLFIKKLSIVNMSIKTVRVNFKGFLKQLVSFFYITILIVIPGKVEFGDYEKGIP